MLHLANAEMPLNVPGNLADVSVSGKMGPDGQWTAPSTAPSTSLGMSSDLSHKESIAKTKGLFTVQTEQPTVNHDEPQGTTASEEYEVQSLAEEPNGDTQNDFDKLSGGVSGDVRIPITVEAINPDQKGVGEINVKKTRRNSAFVAIVDLTKLYIPRGKVHKRATASHTYPQDTPEQSRARDSGQANQPQSSNKKKWSMARHVSKFLTILSSPKPTPGKEVKRSSNSGRI